MKAVGDELTIEGLVTGVIMGLKHRFGYLSIIQCTCKAD
jgi:hypothetical protein